MAFNVANFASKVGQAGVAKASHYQVSISFPAASGLSPDGEDLAFRAESIELPGRSVMAITYRDYGTPREIGYNAMYTPSTITFLASKDLRERTLFTRWQDLIVGSHGAKGFAAGSDFDAGYYENYVATIDIQQYDEAGDTQYKCKLIEAYPRVVNATTLSYASDELIKISVQFQYRYFIES